MTVGILLGRFQPLHYGHIRDWLRILRECDRLVVCIGSAQRAEPLTGMERIELIKKQLVELCQGHRSEVFTIDDPEPIGLWPKRLYETCNLQPGDNNVLYRADEDIPEEQLALLKKLGIKVKFIRREPFYYRCPDGIYRKVSSSTEIKAIHRQFNAPLYHKENTCG